MIIRDHHSQHTQPYYHAQRCHAASAFRRLLAYVHDHGTLVFRRVHVIVRQEVVRPNTAKLVTAAKRAMWPIDDAAAARV